MKVWNWLTCLDLLKFYFWELKASAVLNSFSVCAELLWFVRRYWPCFERHYFIFLLKRKNKILLVSKIDIPYSFQNHCYHLILLKYSLLEFPRTQKYQYLETEQEIKCAIRKTLDFNCTILLMTLFFGPNANAGHKR